MNKQIVTKTRGQCKESIFLGGRRVASVTTDEHGKRILERTLRGSQEMLRSPAAIAFHVSLIAEVEGLGVEEIRVKDSETGLLYTASVTTLRQAGIYFNRGWGDQLALPLKFWNVNGKKEASTQIPMFKGVT